jgi:transposase
MKVKQKISGGFRTTEGAQVFVTISSFISTMRKQGKNIFDSLAAAMAGNVPTVA